MVEFDMESMMRRIKEEERRDRWALAFTGVCPHCKNDKGKRYTDYDTGELEWVPCHFCNSEAEIEEMMQP